MSTCRKELEFLIDKANRAGRPAEAEMDAEGWIFRVHYCGHVMAPVAFAEAEREKPGWPTPQK